MFVIAQPQTEQEDKDRTNK